MAGSNGGDGRVRPEWGSPSAGPRTAGRDRGSPAAPVAKAAGKPAAPKAGGARSRSVASRGAATQAKRRTPEAKGRAAARPARRPSGSFRRRYGVVYDTDGPRVRLGIGWFVVAFVAVVAGPVSTAVVYGGAASVAAAQTARVWRRGSPKPSDLMASGGAGLMAAGACFGPGGAGLGILGCVALAVVGSAGESSPNPRIVDIGWTLQCALAPGAVAVSMVLLTRLDQGSAIGLLLLVSAYEIGDYIVGSGSPNAFEGPGAGAAGIVVITFILSTLPISALSFGQAWVLGGAVAVLAPVGQMVASGLLPAASTPASGLRRLDSLLLAGPAWAWGLSAVL